MARTLGKHPAYGRLVPSVAVAGGLLLVSPTGAWAGTLDQSQPNSTTSGPVGAETLAAQTFTAWLTGQLDQADVRIRRTTNMGPPTPDDVICTGGSGVTVKIHSVSGGAPSDTVLATATIPVGSTPTGFSFVSVAFPAPAAVTAGNQYALVLSAPDAPKCGLFGGHFPYDWSAVTDSNPYAGGGAFFKSGAGSWTVNGANTDNTFKTYVVPSPDGTTPPPDGTTPPPDGTTPPAPSEFPRTLGIAYSKKKDKFKGKLASEAPDCISGQKIGLFEKEKGKDPKLGSDASLANGNYALKEKNAEGKFYATAKQTPVPDGTCLAAKSKTIKVG